MQYQVARTIAAPAERIWKILTDSSAYPSWEPNITKVDGTIAPGQQITVHTKLSSRAFPVKVGDFEPNRKMTWTGGMPLGLFKGVRTFELRAQGDNTEFSMREVFSGPLLGMMKKAMPDLTQSFEDFGTALKARAEQA